MPLIASRWPSQPQTMATRRVFSKWRKHGVGVDIPPFVLLCADEVIE
jgi:hypothetical protein